MKRKDKLLDLDIKMRKAHIERVNKGKCKASLTAPFTNILHLIDRMGNSCINLADVAESGTSMKYFMQMCIRDRVSIFPVPMQRSFC